MNKFLVVLVIVVLSMFVVPTKEVKGEIGAGHSLYVDPNSLISGWTHGWGADENMVLTSISSNIYYQLENHGANLVVTTDTYFSGIYGDPSQWNPYYNLLATVGGQAGSRILLHEFEYDGDSYMLDGLVVVTSRGLYGLYVSDDYEFMVGNVRIDEGAIGAIPLSMSVSPQVEEYPGGQSTWSIRFTTKWYVTMDFTVIPPVPAPGALALVGLGGIMVTRRRRR